MKARIIVTDNRGVTFEGSAELVRVSKSAKKSVVTTHAVPRPTTTLSFSLNPRAFVRKYAKGMNGSQKFTLLLARLVQGKAAEEVSGEQIVSTWKRMKGVIGAYNPAHATRAKERGWIDSPKRGVYTLSSSWRDVMSTE